MKERQKVMKNARRDNFTIGESGVTNSRTNNTVQSSSREAFDPYILSLANTKDGRNSYLKNA